MPHKEILTKEQIKLLPLVSKFIKNFGLVGGTAIGLQIGHRQSIEKIVARARAIFNGEFNERILREQLSYFKDIDYREEVVYLKGFALSGKIIKKELVEFSLS